MKRAAQFIFGGAATLGLAFAFAACGEVGVSGAAYTPVYGDYGYVGPWEPAPFELDGGYFAGPPYRRFDREDEERRRETEINQRAGEEARRREEINRRADENRRQAEVEQEQRRSLERNPALAPVAPMQPPVAAPRPQPHAIPSIPNQPRPERSRRRDERN